MQFHAARNQAMQFCAARNQTNQWRHRNETVTFASSDVESARIASRWFSLSTFHLLALLAASRTNVKSISYENFR